MDITARSLEQTPSLMYRLSRSHAVAVALGLLLAVTGCENEQQTEPADADTLTLQQDTTGADSTRLAYNTFSDWDADDNEDLTQEEFEERFNNYENFDSLDADGDGELARSELEEGFPGLGDFDSLDTDKNNVLSESELNTGVFGRWDANNNQLLNHDEWSRGMSSWRTK